MQQRQIISQIPKLPWGPREPRREAADLLSVNCEAEALGGPEAAAHLPSSEEGHSEIPRGAETPASQQTSCCVKWLAHMFKDSPVNSLQRRKKRHLHETKAQGLGLKR